MKCRTIPLMFLIFILMPGCLSKGDTEIPDELVGVWETSEPRYADRPFEIAKDTIVLEHGGGYFDFVVYSVLRVEKILKNQDTLYTITYITPEEKEYKFSFFYSPANGGIIRFKNQKRIQWVKRASTDWRWEFD